jgi:hypothetical protein
MGGAKTAASGDKREPLRMAARPNPLTSRAFPLPAKKSARNFSPLPKPPASCPHLLPRRGIVRWCGRWGGGAAPLRGGLTSQGAGASPGTPPLRALEALPRRG